jgi:hypothetical protein
MSGEEMTPEEFEAFAREMEERTLDARIVAELERVPDASVVIPADFAARVAAKVPAKPEVAVAPTYYGRKVMWCCFAVLLVVLAVLAARGMGRSAYGTAIEWILCAQFLAIAVWLATRRLRTN